MRVKKYLVNTIEEAEASILKDLGPSAIILSTRPLLLDNSPAGNSGSKIEVIAGAEQTTVKLDEQHSTKLEAPISRSFLKTLKSLEEFFDQNSEKQEVYTPYLRFLTQKGISPFLARSLLKSILSRFGIPLFQNGDQVVREIKKSIVGNIQTTGPILLRRDAPQMIALVGPAGGGKTTTIIKLALQYRDALTRNVGIIAHGLQKPFADTTLSSLCTRFEFNLKNTNSSEQLLEALDGYRQQDLILIDTPGRHFEGTLAQLSSLKGLQMHIVVDGTIGDKESGVLIKEYKPFDPAALIFTKLDQMKQFGSIYNLCEELGIPISYLSKGTAVPHDLEIADPVELTNLILG